MPVPIQETAAAIRFSDRIGVTTAITGSPATTEEAVIATLVLNTDMTIDTGIILVVNPTYVVGTSGTSETIRIRKTNVSGTVLKTTGAVVVAATNPRSPTVVAIDTAPALTGQTYVATLQIGAGAAASTVSAVILAAFIV